MKRSRLDPWHLAAGVAVLCLPLTTHADDWGCQVLLCLSDPRGPRTEAACRPPIDRLYRALAKGHAFPVCTLAGSPQAGGAYAQRVFDPYDPCPAGLRVAAPGMTVAQGKSTPAPGDRGHQIYRLTSTPAVSQAGGQAGWPIGSGARACVGQPVGAYTVVSSPGDEGGYTVNVFDAVVWQAPNHPRAIDVYIDGQLSRRVRY
jgi:hypothetical protein